MLPLQSIDGTHLESVGCLSYLHAGMSNISSMISILPKQKIELIF
jgi:hypothetical protein